MHGLNCEQKPTVQDESCVGQLITHLLCYCVPFHFPTKFFKFLFCEPQQLLLICHDYTLDGSSTKRVRQAASSMLPYEESMIGSHIPHREVVSHRIISMPDSPPYSGDTSSPYGTHIMIILEKY